MMSAAAPSHVDASKDTASSTAGPDSAATSSSHGMASAPATAASAQQHMNTAVLNNVAYPSPRAAAIAKEAVEAAQMYYDLFFQSSEDGHLRRGRSAHDAATPNATAKTFPTNTRQRSASPQLRRSPERDRQRGVEIPPSDSDSLQHPGDGLPPEHASLHHPHHHHHLGGGPSKAESTRASRTSSTHSNDASLLSVQTPVNVVDTAYHTFFPPVLSSVRREAIVERIVGHQPRPYNAWEWHKAEDYHELHAQNVHHNNAYHQYPSTTAITSNATAADKATLDTPLSTSPSYPTMSPVARVANANGSVARASAEDGMASPVFAAAAKMAPTPNAADAAGPSTLPKVPSMLLKEMPFELMSQLSMYTIPASQQGPEYFKKTAEDGTKTLIIFMMGLPARGKTFLAQKICRLLGWHGSRAKVQNIQVAWRRVLLDWEATHADHAAAEGRAPPQKAAVPHPHPTTDAAADSQTRTPSTGAAREVSATPTPPHVRAETDVAVTRGALRRAHALSGHNPSHSSTQDEVSRVVRNLATGALATAQRRSLDAGTNDSGSAAAAASAAVFTAGAAPPHPLRAAATSSHPAAAAVAGTSGAASPVCPSMEAYTALSRDSSACGLPAPAAASPTADLSDCASDVAVAGSPLEAALHSRPPTPTAEAVPPSTATTAAADDVDALAMPAEVLRTRHFRDLIQNPASVARRLYRYVLQSFADDCRLFFQHGGEVVVINDDFVTEELRREAEALFRPLASQFFYMEVIREAAEDPLDFVQCKIRDPMEYPRSDIDWQSATDDFNERLHFLESVYETLGDAAKADSRAPVTAAAPLPPPPSLPRSYVKIRNANTIETHGISGYLASRIISYVMNLSQVKIQHPIYFVRHGESCYNLEDRIGGNPLLTEQGMRDAGALLEFLASLKHHLKHVDHAQRLHHAPNAGPAAQSQRKEQTDATAAAANTADSLEIWTSQLRRAIQTAELSERLLNIRTLRWSSLNEIHAGVCEDMTYDEVSQRYPLIDYFRKRSKYTFRYPEGESYQDLVVRLEPVIMELENADKVVVVVAHQAVLRCLLAYFGSTSAESSISVEVPHRTVWRCTYDSKGIASLDELKLDNDEAGFRLAAKPAVPPSSHASAPSKAEAEAK